MITFILISILGYFVGSIPTAYLIVKKKSNIDIRTAGSGNVGGFNAYEVTGSSKTGVIVGVLDALKGLAVVLLIFLLTDHSFWHSAVALFSAMLGHIFPFWLRFKGGRGLATTAGGMFILGFSYTIVWCTLWVIGRILKREIAEANLIAVIFTPTILTIIPWHLVIAGLAMNIRPDEFFLFSCIISLILVFGHRDVVMKTFQKKQGEKTQ